jgi:hypothetical protein
MADRLEALIQSDRDTAGDAGQPSSQSRANRTRMIQRRETTRVHAGGVVPDLHVSVGAVTGIETA